MSDVEIITTPNAKSHFEPLGRMFVERGTAADWQLLHHLHYKTEGRPTGPAYWRLSLEGETVGVCVLTLPRPMLKERNIAFEQIKPKGGLIDDKISNTARFKIINQNMRVIGRIVLDTLYRGVGAAYRFQNLVARMSGFRFVEIQSAMSKYNLFAQKAGFMMVKPQRSHKYEIGLKFFRSTFSSDPADTAGLLAEIENASPAYRERLLKDTRTFYYRHSAIEKTGQARSNGTSRVERLPVEELIQQLQQMILASPLYGIYPNPDFGREMPTHLPLTAFDRQPTNQALIL